MSFIHYYYVIHLTVVVITALQEMKKKITFFFMFVWHKTHHYNRIFLIVFASSFSPTIIYGLWLSDALCIVQLTFIVTLSLRGLSGVWCYRLLHNAIANSTRKEGKKTIISNCYRLDLHGCRWFLLSNSLPDSIRCLLYSTIEFNRSINTVFRLRLYSLLIRKLPLSR